MSYAHTVTVDLPFDAAVQATRDALAAQGFGIIADIDINAAFAGKLDDAAAGELGDYVILGACNPQLAQQALRGEPDLGLLLPCNVVVRRAPDAATTHRAGHQRQCHEPTQPPPPSPKSPPTPTPAYARPRHPHGHRVARLNTMAATQTGCASGRSQGTRSRALISPPGS